MAGICEESFTENENKKGYIQNQEDMIKIDVDYNVIYVNLTLQYDPHI